MMNMKKIITLLSIAATVAALSSCQKNGGFADGESQEINIALSPEGVVFNSDGTTPDGASSLDVVPVIKVGTHPVKEGWSAEAEGDFVTLTNTVVVRDFKDIYTDKTYETRENGFNLAVTPNAGFSRSFKVTVSYQDSVKVFSFSQKGALGNPVLTLGTASISLTDGGSAVEVAYSTNLSSVEATAKAAWCHPTVNTAAKKISVTCDKYEDTENDRETVVTVVGKQAGSEVVVELAVKQYHKGAAVYDGISSAADFKTFMERLNAGEGFDAFKNTDGVVVLHSDIDMSSIGPWTPAGTRSNMFDGVFDGQNHKIYNMTVNVSTTTLAGFFGAVSGQISNLIVGSKDGVTYDGTSSIEVSNEDAQATWIYAGGIAGYANGATIKNCVNFVPITVTGDNKTRVGGIVGTTLSSTVEGCKNYGAMVNNSSPVKTSTNSFLAGVVGLVDNTAGNTIAKCENHGDVTSYTNRVTRIAGILSQTNNPVTITECKNFGSVTLDVEGKEVSAWSAIAGVLGQNNAQGADIQNCENSGNITSKGLKQVARVGGIIGTAHKNTTLIGNKNSGKISLLLSDENTNWQSAGGIGSLTEDQVNILVKDNVNNGEVYVDINTNTTHNNRASAAGILGYAAAGVFSGNVNNGKVSIKNAGATIGDAIAGGILALTKSGSSNGISFSGNENYGEIKAESASSGQNNGFAAGAGSIVAAGGLVGGNGATIEGTKSVAAVSCTNGVAGAAIGYNFGVFVGGAFGGSVNGTALDASNVAALAVGTGAAATGSVTLGSK